MAKSKSKKGFGIGKILAAVGALLGIVAICMLFTNTAVGKDTDKLYYTGWEMMFGKKNDLTTVLNFSFGNFLVLIFALAGIALSVVSVLGKGGKILPLIAGVALVAAGVFFFCNVAFMSPYVGNLSGKLADDFVKSAKEVLKLGIGAILGGIMAMLGGLATAASAFMKK